MVNANLFQAESLRCKALRAHAKKSRPQAGGRAGGNLLARIWSGLRALVR